MLPSLGAHAAHGTNPVVSTVIGQAEIVISIKADHRKVGGTALSLACAEEIETGQTSEKSKMLFGMALMHG